MLQSQAHICRLTLSGAGEQYVGALCRRVLDEVASTCMLGQHRTSQAVTNATKPTGTNNPSRGKNSEHIINRHCVPPRTPSGSAASTTAARARGSAASALRTPSFAPASPPGPETRASSIAPVCARVCSLFVVAQAQLGGLHECASTHHIISHRIRSTTRSRSSFRSPAQRNCH